VYQIHPNYDIKEAYEKQFLAKIKYSNDLSYQQYGT
jgi:hypothetical protein